MPTLYDKLVRDGIPAIISHEGRVCSVETMPEEAFRAALRRKLVEEAEEAASAEGDQLATELADLYEVIDALLAAHGIDQSSVLARQQERRSERGGFDQRLRLISIEG